MMTQLPRAVEERLLGRPVRDVLSGADRHALGGRRVLITGAGGSVGAELARQIAACGPAALELFDHAEYALFRIERELRASYPAVTVTARLGDVTRREDVRAACASLRPQVIYHAAAYKHVVITETCLIPAVRTNVLGTLEVVAAARACGARLVLISSDKAAEPRSVMGATKRLAELAALDQAGEGFRPVVVRFGNILGSSGSVVEIMLEAARSGRPIPITDPDATRFFMTSAEAVSLVLKAELLGLRTDVFWLDMGDPIRIGDLADRLLAHVAGEGHRSAGLSIIGLRPGEKVREELTTQALAMEPTSHARIWSARQRHIPRAAIRTALSEIRRGCARGEGTRVLDALRSVVTDFEPSATARVAAAGRRTADPMPASLADVRSA